MWDLSGKRIAIGRLEREVEALRAKSLNEHDDGEAESSTAVEPVSDLDAEIAAADVEESHE